MRPQFRQMSPRLGFSRLAFAAMLAASPAAAKLAAPDAAEGARIAAMIDAAEKDDWDRLDSLSAGMSQAGRDLAVWLRLRDEDGRSWPLLQDFLTRHPEWPGTTRMRREAEAMIPASLRPAEVIAFFAPEQPQTGTGALRLARALRDAGRTAEAEAEALRAWTGISMTPAEEDGFLAAFGPALRPQMRARMDMLLWRGLGGEASRAAARLGPGERALAAARSALRDNRNGVDGLISAVPAALADDPGLAYERFVWRDRRGFEDSAETLLRERSTSAAALGRPEAWADRRAVFARTALNDRRDRAAYELAANHHLTEGSDYASLEWFAGWVALRRLAQPEVALKHFDRFAAAVETPISLGRAGYWQGRALETLGRKAEAASAYARAALHQTSFYGQLAAEKLGGLPDPVLTARYPVPALPEKPFGPEGMMEATLLLHAAGEENLSRWFFLSLAALAKGETEYASLGGLALSIGRPELAVRAAKSAARDGGLMPAAYYPLTDLARASGPTPQALAMSIARQESELNPRAVSPAGARGLMQLMPGTAKLVAGKLGVEYRFSALTEDWRYNAMLGQEYLSWLIEEFGALPLAAAAYNAGPHRVRSWLERFGDPRGKGTEAMVDWLETIPYRETRNYAQRVMEGLHVYEVRLSGEAAPVRLASRLGG